MDFWEIIEKRVLPVMVMIDFMLIMIMIVICCVKILFG